MILEKVIKQASKILKSYNIHSHELDAELIDNYGRVVVKPTSRFNITLW